jgi:hypothetical protein
VFDEIAQPVQLSAAPLALIAKFLSLLRGIVSLHPRFISLLFSSGILAKSAEFRGIPGREDQTKGKKAEISLLFPCLTGKTGGARFDMNCDHSQFLSALQRR